MDAWLKQKSLLELMVLPIGLFFCVAYPYLFPDRRQIMNTRFIRRTRNFLHEHLGWNLNKFGDDSNDVDQRWRILPLMASAILFSSTIVMLVEGQMDLFVQTLIVNIVFTSSLMLLPQKRFLTVFRVLFCHHFFTIWNRQDYYVGTGAIKRVVLGKSVVSFIVMSELDEMFFHIAILDLVVLENCGMDCEYSFLGLKMFVGSVLPLTILGFKEFARNSTMFSFASSGIQDARKQFSVSVLTPVITIYTTQTSLLASSPDQLSQFAKLINILHVMMFSFCLALPGVVNGLLAEDKEWRMAEDINQGQEFWKAKNVMNISSIIFGIILMEPTTVALAAIFEFMARVYPEKSRVSTFISHIFVLWVAVGGGMHRPLFAKEKFIAIALATVRVALAFERRPISFVLRDIALLTAITMAIVKDNTVIPSLSFVALVSSVVAIVVAQTRLHAGRVLIRERHSHAFLSHAIKQKYSGVGGALESLLGDSKFSNIMSIGVERLLRGALEECRQGERLCHIVNLVARIRQHTHINTVTWNCLQTVLGQWCESGVLSLATNKLYAIGKGNGIIYQSSNLKPLKVDLNLNLDWDILKLCLCTWAFGSTELKIQVKETTPNEKKGDMYHQVELIMERIGGKRGIFQNNESALSTLLSAIGGRAVAENSIVLSCEALWDPKQGLEGSMSSLSSHDGGESGSIFSSMRDDDSNQKLLRKYDSVSAANSLPSGLVFAILDDNALVRQNVERVCRSKLRADEQRSVFMGAKYEDCEAFLHLIVDNRVDIAIIDENLEYDENRIHVSGTWIARRARQMGFQGYLLLHSANHPVDGLDPCLDAFVEKSASRQQLVTNIINAVQSRRRLLTKKQ